MKRIVLLAIIFLLPVCVGIVFAAPTPEPDGVFVDSRAFVPPKKGNPIVQTNLPKAVKQETGTQIAALWPFGGNADSSTPKIAQPKSSRKAFFLSLILPGLGEYYVGSKRGLIFLGIDAAGWWIYSSYTGKGNDLEDKFERFADDHWRYSAPEGEYSYVEWLANRLIKNGLSDAQLPRNYADLAGTTYMDSITTVLKQEKNETLVSETLPSTKTQQYYEMIGKYDQFVYGWDDIAEHNPTLVDENGKPNGNYDENIENIVSPAREEYENLRHDSNSKLKVGQNGINLLIINRVISAIDAARLAYHHNQGLESELSMIRVNMVQKQILDHQVPMLMVTKKF